MFDYLEEHVPSPLDYSDILRAQVTNVLSAFDALLHDIIHDSMVDLFFGVRKHTRRFESFSLPTAVVLEMLGNPDTSREILSRFVRGTLKKYSYQDPDKVAEGLSLVWDEDHKWQRIAGLMNEDRGYVVKKLKLIAIRRNAIVHESDFDPVLGQLNPIAKTEVEDSISFVEASGIAIWESTRCPQ